MLKYIILFIIILIVIINYYLSNIKITNERFKKNSLKKKYLITFGAGSQNYINAGKRLIEQANNTNYFDKTFLFTDKELKDDKIFWKQHSEFIQKNRRGYGYWIWKPYIIKKTMKEMNDGDILLYSDCGNEIGGKKKDLIPKFFEYVNKEKLIYTTTQIEKEWNKMDLLLYLGVNKDNILNSQQRQAGLVMFLVCKETKDLVNKWYSIACNYHMIDDSPSYTPNLKYFKEHRHDQSIFSLLSKKLNFHSKKTLHDCVYYHRNKTGNSRILN